MYECTCNTTKSSKVIKITTFDQNQFMTCYLILDFRPTYFSYFQKITAISDSHNVKKEGDPKDPFPVVKELRISAKLRHFLSKKKRVGTNKGQSALIRDNWYFLKKITVPY